MTVQWSAVPSSGQLLLCCRIVVWLMVHFAKCYQWDGSVKFVYSIKWSLYTVGAEVQNWLKGILIILLCFGWPCKCAPLAAEDWWNIKIHWAKVPVFYVLTIIISFFSFVCLSLELKSICRRSPIAMNYFGRHDYLWHSLPRRELLVASDYIYYIRKVAN